MSEEVAVLWTPEGEHRHPHPTPVSESRNLSSATKPSLVYPLQHTQGLSTLQSETLQRIFQSFAKRRCFLLGDATGVGKGRTIAGVLRESLATDPQTRAVWVSANMRLQKDATRELDLLGCPGVMPTQVQFSSYAVLLHPAKRARYSDFLSSGTTCLVILDECHHLRNNSSSARAISDMLQHCPVHTHVLYSSATAASCGRHLQYLSPFGLWGAQTPFPTYEVLQKSLRQHGSALMELLAIQMCSDGSYVSRQLSLAQTHIETRTVCLSEAQLATYDRCCAMLRRGGVVGGTRHQRFFQGLLTALKTGEAIRITEDALRQQRSVVISIVSTGEAVDRRARGDPENEDSHSAQSQLLEAARRLVDSQHPLDRILEHFGHTKVAELTGRTRRSVRRSDGTFEWQTKPPMNDEARRFCDGGKHVCVISRAAGVGISLHDAKDGRPRTHIVLEMPWSAEDLTQQMGRTHRTDSVVAPQYIILTTNVPAEMRFSEAIAAKMASMGALVRGDRRSGQVLRDRAPRWSSATKRSLGLLLAAAQHDTDLPEFPPPLTREWVLHSLQIHRPLADCALKPRLTSELTRALAENDASRAQVAVSAAACLYPRDLSTLCVRWSPMTHRYFPARLREIVFTVVACHALAGDTGLGTLPSDILHCILKSVVDPPDRPRLSLTASRLQEHGVVLRNLAELPMDAILNRLLGLEIQLQHTFIETAFKMHTAAPRPPPSCILKYAEDKGGNGVRARIQQIAHMSFGGSVHGVCVGVEYSQRPTPEPPENAHFWKHLKTHRQAWASTSSNLQFSDGLRTHAPALDEALLYARGFTPSTRDAWIRSGQRYQQNLATRCQRLPSVFHVATENPLRMWDQSAQRILQIPPCTQFPRGLTGLLVALRFGRFGSYPPGEAAPRIQPRLDNVHP